MKLIKLSRATLLAVILAGGLTACGGNNDSKEDKDLKELAEDENDAKFGKKGDADINKVSELDAQDLVDAYSAGLLEVRIADTAKVYATTEQGKALAQMLADAHGKANGQMRELAAQKQISLPNDISTEQIAAINKMRDKKRIDFDKNYASEMVSKHKDAIAMYEKCSSECSDVDIKSFFTSSLIELRKHFDMATEAEAKIKTMK